MEESTKCYDPTFRTRSRGDKIRGIQKTLWRFGGMPFRFIGFCITVPLYLILQDYEDGYISMRWHLVTHNEFLDGWTEYPY